MSTLLETWDDWADRIAKEYVHKRKAYEASWGKTKKTASGGLGIGKRGKEGRRNKKENERKEFLDHQKRRLDNYIKAQVHSKTIIQVQLHNSNLSRTQRKRKRKCNKKKTTRKRSKKCAKKPPFCGIVIYHGRARELSKATGYKLFVNFLSIFKVTR